MPPAAFFVGALKDAGAAHVTACVTYLGYARKDRCTQSRDPVTSRYVARLFEAAGFDRVAVLEIHNEAAFDNAFRCETVRLDATPTFAAALDLQRSARTFSSMPAYAVTAGDCGEAGIAGAGPDM